MNTIKVLNFLILLANVESQSKPVYENVRDIATKPKDINIYRKFNKRIVAQPDLQKWKYFQQQAADALNLSRKPSVLQKREIRVQTANNLYPIPQSINFGLNHEENLRLLQNTFGNTQHETNQITVLNSLIGKTPSIQLDGLHQLLKQKDHTPIIENAIDVVNPNTHPNVKVEYATQTIDHAQKTSNRNLLAIAQLEKELNAAAQLQAQQAMAKAQQDAYAHVEAQHRALAAAHVEAQKAAIQKAHTRAIYGQTVNYQPLIVEQTPKPVGTYQPIIIEQKQKPTINYQPIIVEQKSKPAVNYQSLIVPQKRKPAVNYQPISVEQKQKPSLSHQPIIVQQTHVPKIKNVYQENKDNLQYASQYAFGYQVRDYHSKNSFGHEEVRNGKSAKGSYHVLLPDGRKQNVEYWADHTGFHAKVTYDKIAQHPVH